MKKVGAQLKGQSLEVSQQQTLKQINNNNNIYLRYHCITLINF